MSNLTPDSANGAAGAQATPTPVVSGAPSGQPNSSAPIGLDDATVDQLLAHPKFVERLTRATQSAKDRRFADLQKQIADMQAGKATPAEVRKTLDELEGDNSAAVTPGRVTAPAQGADDIKTKTTALLSKYGIAANDPDLLALAQQPVESESEWYLKLAELKTRKQAQPAPTPASAVVVDAAGLSASSRSRDEQRANLTKELNALLSKAGKKDVAKIGQLQADLRSLM